MNKWLRLLRGWLAAVVVVGTSVASLGYTAPLHISSPDAEKALDSTAVSSHMAKAGLADAPWPMFRHDPQHSGRSPYPGPTKPALKWSFQMGYYGGNVLSSPAIGADGTIYVGSWDGKLYAINPEGTLNWSFATGASIYSSPAIGADGTIYIGSYDNKLYAINPEGTLNWSFATGASIYSSPAVGTDGTIYVASLDKNLYAINPEGTLKWSFQAGYMVVSSPAIGPDGTIYIGSHDKNLYAINPDGTLRWSFQTGNFVYSSPAVGADGTIYVGSNDNKLYAINPEGALKWSFQMGDYGVFSSPAVGADGTIYVGSDDHKLYAINPDGTLRWSFLIGNFIFSSPAIAADGTIYVGSDGGRLYAIAEETDPVVQVEPASLSGFLPPDQTVTLPLTIANIGAADLVWSLGEDPAVDWLAQDITAGTVAPDSSQQVQVTFNSTGLAMGDYTTQLHISSNAPDQPLITVPVALTVGQPGLADAPWPMFRHDPQHSGRSPYTGPVTPALKWSFPTGGEVYSSPTIGADSTIYVGSEDHKLYAVNPDGTLRWTFDAGYFVRSSPAINAHGTIYIGSADKKLYAINPDGTLRWSFLTGNGISASPVIGADSTIYVGSWDKNLYAISPHGSLKWSFPTGSRVSASPAIAGDGTIYIGSYDGKLHAINPDGTLKWSFQTGGEVYSSPAVGADGTIYIGSYDKKLYAINPDGTLRWSFPAEDYVYSSPAIGADGTIYVGSWDNRLYAVNPNGTLKWSYPTGGNVLSSPAIGADGTIYVGSGHTLLAINPDGTVKSSFQLGYYGVYSSPAIGADGTIYIGSNDKKLYAIMEGGLDIEVKPGSLERTLSRNETATASLTITVIGTTELVWSLAEQPEVDWLSQDVSAGTLAPGSSQQVQVTFNSTALAPGNHTTQLHISSNDLDEPLIVVPVNLTVLPTAAVTGLSPALDSDKCAGSAAAILQIVDVQTGQPLTVKVGGYLATLTYPGSLVQVVEVRLKPPFEFGEAYIDNPGGKTTFWGIAVAGAPAPIDPLAFIALRLTGTALETPQATLTIYEIADVDGYPIGRPESWPQLTFLRGDVNGDGKVNIADVLFIAQYLAGLRGIGEEVGKLHPVNSASIKDDGACDKITVADLLYLAQYLVGLRNQDMTPKALGSPPQR